MWTSLEDYPSLNKDKPVVLSVVRRRGRELRFADATLQDDFDVVKAAVSQDSNAVRFASERLMRNPEIMLLTINDDWSIDVCGILRTWYAKDRVFALQAVQRDGCLLSCFHDDLQNDKEVFLRAVQQTPYAWRGLACCDDFGFVQQAIEANPLVCDILVRSLNSTWSIFKHAEMPRLMALHGHALAFEHWFPKRRTDKEFILSQVQKNGLAFLNAPKFHDNEDVVLAAVSQNGLLLQHACMLLRQSEKIAAAAVSQNGLALSFCQDLNGNKDIVLKAVAQNGKALQFAHESLKSDPEVVLRAVAQTGYALQWVRRLVAQHTRVYETAVLQNGYAFANVLQHMQSYSQNPHHMVQDSTLHPEVDLNHLAVLAVRTKGVFASLNPVYRTQQVMFAAVKHNLCEIRDVVKRDMPTLLLEAAFAEHFVASCLEATPKACAKTILSKTPNCWLSLCQRIAWVSHLKLEQK